EHVVASQAKERQQVNRVIFITPFDVVMRVESPGDQAEVISGVTEAQFLGYLVDPAIFRQVEVLQFSSIEIPDIPAIEMLIGSDGGQREVVRKGPINGERRSG